MSPTHVSRSIVWLIFLPAFALGAVPQSAPVQVSPANGAMEVPRDQHFCWQSVSGASSYHVKVLVNKSIVRGEYSGAGFSDGGLVCTTFDSLKSSQVYSWMVSAVNADGEGAPSGLWIFTSIYDPPSVSMIYPGAFDVGLTPLFSWISYPPALGTSHIQVAADSGFQSLLFEDSTINNTYPNSGYDVQFPGQLAKATTYYWRVKVRTKAGQSGWCTRPFTTIPDPPDPTSLISPTDSAFDLPVALSLSWHSSARTERYHLQVSTDSAFSSFLLNDSLIQDTSANLSSLALKSRYYWRVRAWNGGGSSDWTTVRSFTTLPPPPDHPTLLYPNTYTTHMALKPTFSWTPVPGSIQYLFRLEEIPDAGPAIVVDTGSIAGTSRTLGPLKHYTLYRWFLSAKNAGGQSESTSVAFKTIPDIPSTPVLSAPASGAMNLPTTLTAIWHKAGDEAEYKIQISKNADFGNPINLSGPIDTTWIINGLENDTKYYWRVSALNSQGESPFSQASDFTTIVRAPDEVTMVYPGQGDTVTSDTIVAHWMPGAPKIDRYWLEASMDSNFTSSIIDSNITDTLKAFSFAGSGGTAWWRVKAHNAAGWGKFVKKPWFVISKTNSIRMKDVFLRINARASGQGMLSYTLPKTARVHIQIHDSQGKLQATPVDAVQAAGFYSCPMSSGILPSGWYFLILRAGNDSVRNRFYWKR